MVSGPEQSRLLKEFEEDKIKVSEYGYHHKEGFSIQKTFKEESVSLIQVFSEFGNPFLDDSNELLVL